MSIQLENFQRCQINGDKNNVIYLLRPSDLTLVPDETELTSISGSIERKTRSLDLDTRCGYLAFGLRKEQIDQLCLVEARLDKKL